LRSVDPTGAPTPAPPWSEAELVALTIRLAHVPEPEPAPERPHEPAPERPHELAPERPHELAPERAPADAGPLSGRVAHRRGGVVRPSTAPLADREPGVSWSSTAPGDQAWSVPLLITDEVEAWLLGWPAGLVTPVHDHGGAAVALTVVEGALSEECLDPTIWTTGRRTTWRAGSATVFPPGHVHLLGAAGGRPALAVHAWSGPAGSAHRGAGRPRPGRARAVPGGGPGGGRDLQAVGLGPGRGGDACLGPGQPAHGALDLGRVGDRVAG
jgi:quercetin dioxygenase-like cupin family protein